MSPKLNKMRQNEAKWGKMNSKKGQDWILAQNVSKLDLKLAKQMTKIN